MVVNPIYIEHLHLAHWEHSNFLFVITVLGISLYSWMHSSVVSKHGRQLQFRQTLRLAGQA